MTSNDTIQSMYRDGLLDERKAATFGVMDSPLGEFSCVAAIKGNSLKIYLSDAGFKLGTLRHEIAICNLKLTKSSSFFLNPQLRFDYKGKHYALTRFGNAKEFLSVFMKEYEK